MHMHIISTRGAKPTPPAGPRRGAPSLACVPRNGSANNKNNDNDNDNNDKTT